MIELGIFITIAAIVVGYLGILIALALFWNNNSRLWRLCEILVLVSIAVGVIGLGVLMVGVAISPGW